MRSLPSKRFILIDAPEVYEFGASFQYNFFVKDERVNEEVSLPASVRELDFLSEDTQTSNLFNRFVPRSISLFWSPVTVDGRPDDLTSVSIEENASKIQAEEFLSGDNFVTLSIQDEAVDERLNFYVRRMLEDLRNQQRSEGGKPDPFQRASSPLDVARFLSERMGDEISSDFLVEVLTNFQGDDPDYLFFDEENKQILLDTIIETLKSVSIKTRLSILTFSDSINSNVQSPLRLLTDDLLRLKRDWKASQQRANLLNPSNIMNSAEYDFEILDYIDVRSIDSSGFNRLMTPIGYVIEKEELTPNGIVKKNPLFIETPNTSFFVDPNVKYGTTYRYRIRTVVLVRARAEDLATNEFLAVDFLVGSGWSPWETVQTEERLAPPSPVDIGFVWDYASRNLCFHWTFPVNQQRDIKYFQVFRRSSLSEPFELMRMFDFDDSIERSPVGYERPDPQLVDRMRSPKSFWIDPDFNETSTFIYSVVAVDAHLFSSPYSVQFEVSFDKTRNKLVKRQISPAGAPKPYPNLYVNSETFVDVIKTEGYEKVKLYFHPEVLTLTDSKGNDKDLICMNPDTSYRFQMTNIDLQEQQTVDVSVENRSRNT